MWTGRLATLVALVAFVQVIESVSGEYAKYKELYEKVFGAKSEPMEPEEARKAIEQIHEARDEVYEYEFCSPLLVTGLSMLERRAKECNFDPFGFDMDARYFNSKQPALQPYLESLRSRMVECFRNDMDAAVENYSSMAKADETGAYAHLKESLADMPLELLVKHNFVKTKDEKISKILVSVMEKKHGECVGDDEPKAARSTSCWRRKSTKSKTPSYTQLFLDSVVNEFCKKVVDAVLVPEIFQPVAFKKDTIGMLGQEAVEWAKVHHLCQQITSEPNLAAEIVYNTYLETAQEGLE